MANSHNAFSEQNKTNTVKFNIKFFDSAKSNINDFINQLNKSFPIDYSSHFQVYPFSNEHQYSKVLEQLKNSTNIFPRDKIRVALLFGESNFLSILPEISKHVDLIILADIEAKQHQHTKHLLECLSKSNTPDEFKNNYINNNPLANLAIKDDDNVSVLTIQLLIDMLTGKLGATKLSLQDYHFLNSLERFNECKMVSNQVKFAHMHFNLLDKNQCKLFSELLINFNAILTFCNLTNIHDYDNEYRLPKTVPIVLHGSPNCFVMYSTNKEKCNFLTNNIEDYLKNTDWNHSRRKSPFATIQE